MPRKKKDVGDLAEQGRWIEPAELTGLADDNEKRVRGEVEGVGQDRPLGSSIARKLHNAVLVGVMWSHLLPVRCCSLRWLQIPG